MASEIKPSAPVVFTVSPKLTSPVVDRAFTQATEMTPPTLRSPVPARLNGPAEVTSPLELMTPAVIFTDPVVAVISPKVMMSRYEVGFVPMLSVISPVPFAFIAPNTVVSLSTVLSKPEIPNPWFAAPVATADKSIPARPI